MMRTWKLGISAAEEAPETAPLLLTGNMTEIINRAAALGYDAVEIHTREEPDWDPEEIRALLDTSGMKISAVVSGRIFTEGQCSLTDDRPYVEKACMDGMRKYINLAAALGTDLIIGWARGNLPAGKSPAPYLKRLGKNLKILNETAKKAGVRIMLEVINHYEMSFLRTCEETLRFIEQYSLDNCCIHLDTYHMQLEETDYAAAIRLAGNRLGYFHVSDNTRWYPGSGTLPFDSIFRALAETGYQGYVVLECLPKGDRSATAAAALRSLEQLTAREVLFPE